MIPNQAQPATTGGQTQAPTLDAPSENTLFNADPAALDFGHDPETGEFKLMFKKAEEAQAAAIETGITTTQPEPKTQDNTQFEDRFARIEGAMINLAGVLQGMQTNQPAQQTQQEAQQPDLDVNSSDFATNLVNMLNSAIDKKFSSFEDKLKPMQQNVSDINDRVLLTDLGLKYGQDFIDLLPAMTEYKKSDPTAKWETLYNAMSKIPRAKKDSTIQTTNGSVQNGKPQVDLAQRAQQLATVRDGVPNSVLSEAAPTKMSVQQAAEKAIRDLFGN